MAKLNDWTLAGLKRTINRRGSPGAAADDDAAPNGTNGLESPLQELHLDEWQEAQERARRSVVVIKWSLAYHFDTENASTHQGSGFVVDKERGIILTNRHIVGPGPSYGRCLFPITHEEIDAWVIYRDPIHDFAFLAFDPKAIRYTDLVALDLRPDLAKVGLEIKVIGNDAAEVFSIQGGTISRLDRNAPEYGLGYNDFNTFYIQASSINGSGSSGSPVVNKDGHVVALMCGGRGTIATRFFLPLDRPRHALQCLQEGRPIPRGTIQCQWRLESFADCHKLGLSSRWEDEVRQNCPGGIGMLVAKRILPEGPSAGKIKEGDILIKVNGQLLTHFVRLDEILDGSVSSVVRFLLHRGQVEVEVDVDVGDLYAITPDRFVSVGDAGPIFHSLSYQYARYYEMACKGVFIVVASASCRNLASRSIILSVDNRPTPTLEAFIEVMRTIPDRAQVWVTYKELKDRHTTQRALIDNWAPDMKLVSRNDGERTWKFTDLAEALPPVPKAKQTAHFVKTEDFQSETGVDLSHSLASVEVYMSTTLDGFPWKGVSGMGIIVDAERGLVVTSRALVSSSFSRLLIQIADSVLLDGSVVYLHPFQGWVMIRYDPSLVDGPVVGATLSTEPLKTGATVNFIGGSYGQLLRARTTVTQRSPIKLTKNRNSPRYRVAQVHGLSVESGVKYSCDYGILSKDDGTVGAFWMPFVGGDNDQDQPTESHYAISTSTLLPFIKMIQEGEVPKIRFLDIEYNEINIHEARQMGVSESWIEKATQSSAASYSYKLLRVSKKTVQREGSALKENDVILALNGKVVTDISDLDVMYWNENLEATIVREREEHTIEIRTTSGSDIETSRFLNFYGAILQAPHHEVKRQLSRLPSEIYVSSVKDGSFAQHYGLQPTNFITAINDCDTPNLDTLLKVVKQIPENTYLRLRLVDLAESIEVITMKKNNRYFGLYEMLDKDGSWGKIIHDTPTTAPVVEVATTTPVDPVLQNGS